MCYNFPRACLKGRFMTISLSLFLSLYHAHALHQLRYPPNWFPITHLYTRMHPLWVIKRISFQVHARACSETFHWLHIIQKRIPRFLPPFWIIHQRANIHSLRTRQCFIAYYTTGWDRCCNRANLMHYLFVIFHPRSRFRASELVHIRTPNSNNILSTLTIFVMLILNLYYFLKRS